MPHIQRNQSRAHSHTEYGVKFTEADGTTYFEGPWSERYSRNYIARKTKTCPDVTAELVIRKTTISTSTWVSAAIAHAR